MLKYFFRKIILFTAGLFYIGCSSNIIRYPEPSVNAKDGSYILKEGRYELGEKEYRADYGTLTVPENRNDPHSRLIHLPFIHIYSNTQTSNEPVFGLAGGPGQSNLAFHPVDSLLSDRDFILVGYRGVEGSTVLDCPEVTKQVENLKSPILSEQTLKKIGDAWKLSLERFKVLGIDINGYTIPQVIEDMEAVRKILKYNKINLIAESYGTRVAYLYGVIHPESLHRTIMIGVNPPGGFIWTAKRTDQIIKKYSELWAKDSIKSKKCPDISAAIRRVIKNMPPEWNSFSIDPGKVRIVTFAMLFHRKEAALVFNAYAAADKGDYSGLALLSQGFNMMMPKMVWGDMAAKAISADLEYWKQYENELSDDSTIIGAPMTEFYWKALKYGDLNINPIPDSLRKPMISNVETLMLSGNLDITNPPECGAELLKYLQNGKQIIMSESGHVGDIRYLQLNATKHLIAEYINKGIVDTSQIKYVPMDFNVDISLNGLAKMLLTTARLLVLLITAGVVWLIV